ncbi:655_t:CDS:2 [Funneliformis geosporum]|uniref:655_t:CDS:1 n=1 Tax=Funneliformis geosporum TaxID=1117311 RepID=A0A9W4WUN6_9GLOM|nr:655_t:CDS:2 [Funneliformis geosporum]
MSCHYREKGKRTKLTTTKYPSSIWKIFIFVSEIAMSDLIGEVKELRDGKEALH